MNDLREDTPRVSSVSRRASAPSERTLPSATWACIAVGALCTSLPKVATGQAWQALDAGLLADVSVEQARAPQPTDAGRSVTEREVVALSQQQSPKLRAALIDVERAQEEVRVEDNLFVPIFQADGGFTYAESPRLLQTGAISRNASRTWELGVQLGNKFRWGTELTLRFEGYRSTSTQQLTPGSDESVTLGPSYGTVGRLTLTQPFLRGAGREVGEAALRQARLAKTSAERARDVAASQLLRDALVAYWELWYSTRSVDIEQNALALAQTERDGASGRAQRGALAVVDVLSYETRVAQLQQSVATAHAARRQKALELTRLLGSTEFAQDLRAADEEPPTDRGADLSRERATIDALSLAPEVRQAEADVATAVDRLRSAGESERARLDLEGYVQSEQLAYRRLPPALDHLSERPAFSAHVGLVFELPVSGAARSASRRAAGLSVEAAQARLSEERQAIEAQVWKKSVDMDSARERIALAQAAVAASAEQVEAQRKRYEGGVGILLEVQQAQDSQRSAELTEARARVDYVEAALELRHLSGQLLTLYVSPSAASSSGRRSSRATVSVTAERLRGASAWLAASPLF